MKKPFNLFLIVVTAISGLLFVIALVYSLVLAFQDRAPSPSPSPAASSTALAPAASGETTPEATSTALVDAEAEDLAGTPRPQADNNITWNGLKIEIVRVDDRAWPLINANNQFNDPPQSGWTMRLITLRISNQNETPEEIVDLTASDFTLLDSNRQIYETFRRSCGVIPDELDSVIPPGGSVDGKICFQTPQTQTDFTLIYEPFDFPAVSYDLPPPSAQTRPVQTPPLVVEADPSPIGLKLGLVQVKQDAWPLIEAQNQNNDPPLAGMRMLLITVRVANVSDQPESFLDIRDSDFQLIGSNNQFYKSFQVSCGVIPDSLAGVVGPGEWFDGNVCFQVPQDETDFRLVYTVSGEPGVELPLPD